MTPSRSSLITRPAPASSRSCTSSPSRAPSTSATPWVAANLLSAFTRAKDNSVARLRELTASRIPLPWTPEVLDRSHELLFSEEYWPYGVEPNHVTLDAFARYAHEQGVASRLMRPEELFAPEVLSSFKV